MAEKQTSKVVAEHDDHEIKPENSTSSCKETAAHAQADKSLSNRQEESVVTTDKEESNDDEVDSVAEYLQRLLLVKEKEESPLLDELTLDGVAKYMLSEKCKNVIVMTGAGISTAAGIPDFRSPETGLYNKLEKYNLPHPQAVFEIGFFRENPLPFYTLAKELYPSKFQPTLCHYFIRLLHEMNILLRNYTQNIDTLERRAGVPAEKLVEAHGTFHTAHCIDCGKEFSENWVKDKVFADEVPFCTDESSPLHDTDYANAGLVKPDIVFFGEALPSRFFHLMQSDFRICDLLLIMGTSLVVQPFASLVDRVPASTPRLLINKEKAGQNSPVMRLLGLEEGLDFDSETNTRDVFWEGDCDSGCMKLAEALGWEEELKKLYKSGQCENKTTEAASSSK